MEYNRRTNRLIFSLVVKFELDPIYMRVAKAGFNWARTWWCFKLDDGSRPLFDIMDCRPAAAWEGTRLANSQWDYKTAQAGGTSSADAGYNGKTH